MNLGGKWKAILVGGLITGLAPFIPIFNLACCLIPLGGAIVAVAVYSSSSPRPPINNSDGIILGAMSGVLGTVLFAILMIPLVVFAGSILGGFLGSILPNLKDIPAGIQPLLGKILANLGGVFGIVVFAKILGHLGLSLLFGIIGGLIGVGIFKNYPTS